MAGRIEGIRTICPRSGVGGRDIIHLIAWEKALLCFDFEAWAGAQASWTRSYLFRSTCWAAFLPTGDLFPAPTSDSLKSSPTKERCSRESESHCFPFFLFPLQSLHFFRLPFYRVNGKLLSISYFLYRMRKRHCN